LKSFVGLLSLIALNLIPFSFPAAQPAAITAGVLAGFSLTDTVPAPEPPLLYNPAAQQEKSLSGEALFNYLRAVTAPEPRRTSSVSYRASKAYMYSTADNTGCSGAPGILTFYSQVCVKGASDNGNDYGERGDLNDDGVVDSFVNAEHIWPQGYFKSALPMVADLHHLASTFVTPNGRRGNLKFAEVSRPSYSTSAGSMLGREGFEPADAVKGNVARALFYFIVRYGDKNIRQGMDYASFWINNVPMFLEWNRQDPPDDNERRRNDLVEDFQGNRNPFIDNPALAENIGEMVLKSH